MYIHIHCDVLHLPVLWSEQPRTAETAPKVCTSCYSDCSSYVFPGLCGIRVYECREESGRWHAAENDDVIRHMKILIWGLVFSCIGDGCLVFPRRFQLGLLSFAVAQCIYIHLFGLNLDLLYNLPLQGLFSAVGVALLSGTIMVGFWIQLKSHMRNLSLKLPIVTGVVVYFILVSTMLWSAVLRLQLNGDWASGLGVVGAILFYISDLLMGWTWEVNDAILNAKS